MRQVFRSIVMSAFAATAVGAWLAPSTCADDDADAPAESAPQATATDQTQAAALEVQRALGGPLTNQFPNLQPQADSTPWWKQFSGSLDASSAAQANPVPANPGSTNGSPQLWPSWWSPAPPRLVLQATAEAPSPTSPRPQVVALRNTAAELDATANRLEELELYDQSDALRDLAQRMRVEARRRMDGRQSATEADEAPADAQNSADPFNEENTWSPSRGRRQDSSNGRSGIRIRREARIERRATDDGDPAAPATFEERSVLVGPKPE